MSLKEMFKRSYWNEQRLSLLIGFLSLVATVIIGIHPAFLYPEEIDYNSEIQLKSTLLSQQSVIFFESFNQSNEMDKIEDLYIKSLNDKKYVYFKLAETGNPERSILVMLIDPTNIVRFSSPLVSNNLINPKNLPNLRLHTILVNRYTKIRIPDLSGTYIEGTWHLNVYVYNSAAELTLVASKPIEGPIISNKDSNNNYLGLLVPPIAYFIIYIITKMIKGFNEIKNIISVNDKKNKQEVSTKQNDSKEISQLKTLEGLVVEVPKQELIRRCPQCSKILNGGECLVHGEVRGEYDLYLEAKIYNGISEHLSRIKKPVLEKPFGIDVNGYINTTEGYLDPRVFEVFSKQIIGKWISLSGTYSIEGFDAESIKINDQLSLEESLNLYERWESNKKS